MSTQIPTAFVKEYNAGVRLLQQQMGTRLRDAVMVDPSVEGDRSFYDQVDAVEMAEVTNRHGDTEYIDTPHKRRMVTLKTYEVADLVDRADRRRLLNDPINPYTRAQAAAANRRLDRTIIAAFTATASTGVDGSGTAPFDTTNFQFDTAATMDLSDLTLARSTLEEYENMEDDGDNRWFALLSAQARKLLLADTEVTSSDYNSVKALVNGQIDQYLGFTFIKSQLVPTSGDLDRSQYFWVKSSMRLAIGQEPRSFMDILPQKRHSIQVRHELDIGATRMDEKGVFDLILDETP